MALGCAASLTALVAFLALFNPWAYAQVQQPSSRTHTYYIAADEVPWDYAPLRRNMTGLPLPEKQMEAQSSVRDRYIKAIYREYTDETFKVLKPRQPEWEHLGILGPLIRAEVGDTIKVTFRNNTKLPFLSMHAHGLAYGKDSEGARYDDNAHVDKGDHVGPGEMFTYTWSVPERAGPGPDDPSSILWMYHSHFAEDKEINAGLIGPIIVTRRGFTKPDGAPRDVDREFIAGFMIFDETATQYFDKERFPPNFNFNDPVLRQPYLQYTINGMIEGNLPAMTMKKGERVRWYLLSSTNEDDVHGAHWHGQTVIYNHMRTDVVNLGPMQMAVADMVPDNVGTWLLHCHVNEHLREGMSALFSVLP